MTKLLGAILVLSCTVSLVQAGQVEIVKTEFTQQGEAWNISTTLRHDDTGWDQYADAWRMVSEAGDVLGTRVLYHPHENEQPFTRSLAGVKISDDRHVVYVEAHCKVHGWSSQRLRVDLHRQKGERFQVHR